LYIHQHKPFITLSYAHDLLILVFMAPQSVHSHNILHELPANIINVLLMVNRYIILCCIHQRNDIDWTYLRYCPVRAWTQLRCLEGRGTGDSYAVKIRHTSIDSLY